MEFDEVNQTCHVSPRAEEILVQLQEMQSNSTNNEYTASWHPEYGRYMLEGIPKMPYSPDTNDLILVEKDMLSRRCQVGSLLKDNERVLTVGNFPRLGCVDSFPPTLTYTNEASKSEYFPDEMINSHIRFK